MAKKKSQAFTAVILLLALAASATLLGYLVLSPADPDSGGNLSGSGESADGTLEFEFYDRLQQNEVQVNTPAGEPAEPGPPEVEQPEAEQPEVAQPEVAQPEVAQPEVAQIVEQLAEQSNPAAQTQLEVATEALEQIAETIVTGLETPAPGRVAAPEPVRPAPTEPQPPAATVLAAPSSPAPAPANTNAARLPGTVLQSGAYSQQELALSELQRQRNLGLEVEIRQRSGQNGPLFLLHSGPYDSRDKLEEAEMVFRLHNIATARLSTP